MNSKNLHHNQVQLLRNAVLDPKVVFCFVPSPVLREKIALGTDEDLNMLSPAVKQTILEMPNGSGIAISNDLVLKYLEGTIDSKNLYMLNNGEIKAIPTES